MSGTSMTWGERVEVAGAASSTYVYWNSLAYDENADKLVVAFRDASVNSQGVARVGTISGSGSSSTVSWGTKANFAAYTIQATAMSYDPTSQKIVLSWSADSTQDDGSVCLATISGTNISFTSAQDFYDGNHTLQAHQVYDTLAGKHISAYVVPSGAAYIVEFTVNSGGTALELSTPVQVYATTPTYLDMAYDTVKKRVLLAYKASSSNSSYGSFQLIATAASSTNLTVGNYLGISNGAYADGATATIQTIGAIDDAQSSLTTGTGYFVQGDGSMGTSATPENVFAGIALSATTILIKG